MRLSLLEPYNDFRNKNTILRIKYTLHKSIYYWCQWTFEIEENILYLSESK